MGKSENENNGADGFVESSDLLAVEKRWIRRMRKCCAEMPDTLIPYSIDTNLTICKRDVSSYEISESIEFPVNSGCMLTDIHDDENFGEGH